MNFTTYLYIIYSSIYLYIQYEFMYEMPPQCLEMRQMSRPASHDEFQQGRQGQGGAVDDVELSRGLAQRAVRLDQPKTVGNQESCCKIYGFPIGC